MRSLALLCLLSSAALAAPLPSLEFAFTWEQGEHSRDMSGSRSVFTLKGAQLTHTQKSWGRQLFPGGKGEKKRSIQLTAAQFGELAQAVAATEGLQDVRVEEKQDVGSVIEASLAVAQGKGKSRTLVLEAYPTNDHVRGPKAEILDPEDAGVSPAPSVKTYAAMHALYLKLLGLFPLAPP